ncbi:DinB family protein [Dictyobacter formicarum]|uniref:DinB-like domain-containing protein n=1 Tax=Dictyobacter formicarum TaxID=2778368 RepID=A0ABQ3VG23_9CHLR|nr:DinB family protein [Dictyobacter formicarum]GHO84955.1 hypothetical protein KSZ_29610 [Dictyobacter formicarum]
MDAQTFFLLQYDVVRMLADELLLVGIDDDQLRYAPGANHHSLIWLLWHITRWEDVAITMLGHGLPQVLLDKNWVERLGCERRDMGGLMTVEECQAFNATIDPVEVRAYRQDVELRTRLVVESLRSEELDDMVPENHFQQVLATGVLGGHNAIWLERFLQHRSRGWWLSSIIWHQSAYLLGEAAFVRHQTGLPSHPFPFNMG